MNGILLLLIGATAWAAVVEEGAGGAAPRQMQGTDFVGQFNSAMQQRVNQLNARFPWAFRPDACDLSVELFPLYYVPILRAATTRVLFSSNCLTTRDVTFEVSFDDELFINWVYHPTTLYLNLWGNVYRLEFSAPAVIDRFDVMKSLEYSRVTVHNANAAPQTVDLASRNVLYLRPQHLYAFSRENLRKLRNTRGYLRCEKTSRRLPDWETLAPQRDRLVARLRAEGETEEVVLREVDKLVRALFTNADSEAVVPPVLPSADALKTASAELREEVERLRAREDAKKAFMREFIEDFEIDCQIL